MTPRHLSPLAFFLLIGLVAAEAGAADALQRTEGLVRAFQAVKTAKEGETLSAADRQANVAAFAALDAYFDYDYLTRQPVAGQKDKLSGDKLASFSQSFRDLIRLVAYPKSGKFLSDAKFTLKLGKKQGKRTDVLMHARLEAEDFETTVTFHWEESAAGLRIVDVSFDGGSLIKDYTNQFTGIINKDGADGLLAKLQKRLDKERKESVVAP